MAAVIICGCLALVALAISVASFLEKGFLLNNAYLWASRQEREQMDKKPHYRQTAIVFAFLAAIFLCIGLEALLHTGWLWLAEAGLLIAVTVYAIKSSSPLT